MPEGRLDILQEKKVSKNGGKTKRRFDKLGRRLISLKSSLVRRIQRVNEMPYCPECGGEMHYAIAIKHYCCKSCGLSVTQQELMELREKNRPNPETAEEEKDNQRKEYLKWWLSKKK